MHSNLRVGLTVGLILFLAIVLSLSTGIISFNVPSATAQAAPAPPIVIGDRNQQILVEPIMMSNGVYSFRPTDALFPPALTTDIFERSLVRFIIHHPELRIVSMLGTQNGTSGFQFSSVTVVTEPRTQ